MRDIGLDLVYFGRERTQKGYRHVTTYYETPCVASFVMLRLGLLTTAYGPLDLDFVTLCERHVSNSS